MMTAWHCGPVAVCMYGFIHYNHATTSAAVSFLACVCLMNFYRPETAACNRKKHFIYSERKLVDWEENPFSQVERESHQRTDLNSTFRKYPSFSYYKPLLYHVVTLYIIIIIVIIIVIFRTAEAYKQQQQNTHIIHIYFITKHYFLYITYTWRSRRSEPITESSTRPTVK